MQWIEINAGNVSKKHMMLIVRGTGTAVDDFATAIQASYDKDITDEFIAPLLQRTPTGMHLLQLKKMMLCSSLISEQIADVN